MHRKGEFAKIKFSICNMPFEAANICNIFSKPPDSNRLTVCGIIKTGSSVLSLSLF